MAKNYYETGRALSEYLLFHYALDRSLLPLGVAESVLGFPARCVSNCLETGRLPSPARALDLGCSVGRSAFELARTCAEVIAIDNSKLFIRAAGQLQTKGACAFDYVEEGNLVRRGRAVVPRGIDRRRVRFQVGDAGALPRGIGQFDVLLMANLLDRLPQPAKCLRQLPALVKAGGQLILTSPYTWLPNYTPRAHWLGGFLRSGKRVRTFEALKTVLSPDFRLLRRSDLPFLIREHARKFQFGIADASVWLRK